MILDLEESYTSNILSSQYIISEASLTKEYSVLIFDNFFFTNNSYLFDNTSLIN